eukprot:3788535-Rhodomonas_salina.1
MDVAATILSAPGWENQTIGDIQVSVEAVHHQETSAPSTSPTIVAFDPTQWLIPLPAMSTHDDNVEGPYAGFVLVTVRSTTSTMTVNSSDTLTPTCDSTAPTAVFVIEHFLLDTATIKAVSCFSHIPSQVLTNTYTVVAAPFAHCSVRVSWNITRGNI